MPTRKCASAAPIGIALISVFQPLGILQSVEHIEACVTRCENTLHRHSVQC